MSAADIGFNDSCSTLLCSKCVGSWKGGVCGPLVLKLSFPGILDYIFLCVVWMDVLVKHSLFVVRLCLTSISTVCRISHSTLHSLHALLLVFPCLSTKPTACISTASMCKSLFLCRMMGFVWCLYWPTMSANALVRPCLAHLLPNYNKQCHQ